MSKETTVTTPLDFRHLKCPQCSRPNPEGKENAFYAAIELSCWWCQHKWSMFSKEFVTTFPGNEATVAEIQTLQKEIAAKCRDRLPSFSFGIDAAVGDSVTATVVGKRTYGKTNTLLGLKEPSFSPFGTYYYAAYSGLNNLLKTEYPPHMIEACYPPASVLIPKPEIIPGISEGRLAKIEKEWSYVPDMVREQQDTPLGPVFALTWANETQAVVYDGDLADSLAAARDVILELTAEVKRLNERIKEK